MLLPINVEEGYKKYCSLVCRDIHGNISWYVFKEIILLEEHLTPSFFFFQMTEKRHWPIIILRFAYLLILTKRCKAVDKSFKNFVKDKNV